MPNCPRCQQPVSVTAIDCPHCRLTLKAHGHPGITLHRAKGETSLCDTCTYHADDTCTFPQRPNAQTCTLYQDRHTVAEAIPTYQIPWWRKYSGWIAVIVLIVISVMITVL